MSGQISEMNGVLIDITRLVHRFVNKRLPTGVDRVSLAYIRRYQSNARAVLRHKGGKFVYGRIDSAKLFDWVLSFGKTNLPILTIYGGMVTALFEQNVTGRFLFNTGHSGLEVDGYVSMLRSQRVRPIFMVHDLIPLTHPQFCREGEQHRHLARLRNAVSVAQGLIFNSEATKYELCQLCDAQGWRMPPSTVALLAPELPPFISGPRMQKYPYFVFVSTIEPRKNHLMLLKVWEKLALQFPDTVPHLVIIGQRGWGFEEVARLLAESAVLQGLVIEIPHCSDADLVQYLHDAQALLFPSFAEGYGMPVVEALAHGVPVIANNLPVFREFAGEIPEYVAIEDPDLWGQFIIRYSDLNDPYRVAQIERIKSFVQPNWVDHFKQVDALLDRISQH